MITRVHDNDHHAQARAAQDLAFSASPDGRTEYAAYVEDAVPGQQTGLRRGRGRRRSRFNFSRKEFQELLLPQGLETSENYFFTFLDSRSAPVGTLWFAVKTSFNAKVADVFDVGVRPERQREGRAMRTLRALEDELRSLGLCGIALHVFVPRHYGSRAVPEAWL
jgi:GNAT superfamily N-acetyltransferase